MASAYDNSTDKIPEEKTPVLHNHYSPQSEHIAKQKPEPKPVLPILTDWASI